MLVLRIRKKGALRFHRGIGWRHPNARLPRPRFSGPSPQASPDPRRAASSVPSNRRRGRFHAAPEGAVIALAKPAAPQYAGGNEGARDGASIRGHTG